MIGRPLGSGQTVQKSSPRMHTESRLLEVTRSDWLSAGYHGQQRHKEASNKVLSAHPHHGQTSLDDLMTRPKVISDALY